MGFSYSGNPQNSEKDEVRFLLGDTDSSRGMLQDAEILYLITSEGSTLHAAVAGAIALAAKFARASDETVGSVSKSYSQRAEAFHKLAKVLKTRDAVRCVAPYAGGISEADKLPNEMDPDAVDPAFRRDLHDNNRTSSIDSGDDLKC